MDKKELLEKLGFDPQQTAQFLACCEVLGDVLSPKVTSFINGETDLTQVSEYTKTLEKLGLHKYAVDLVFLVACVAEFRKKLPVNGVSEEVFLETMRDISYKMRECEKVKKVFGTFDLEGFKASLPADGWLSEDYSLNLNSTGASRYRSEHIGWRRMILS